MKLKMLRDVATTDPQCADPSCDKETDRIDDHSDSSSIRSIIASQYLLVCEATSSTMVDGHWRFSLESADGSEVMEAEDEELGDLNRLTLLAAIRGLEAIDGPSSVTLLSNNRYLIRSLSDSLPRWRENGFAWEHFGRRVDVQHADLWRRIDRTLAIHRVEACLVSSRLVSRGTQGNHGASGRPLAGSSGNIARVDSPHAKIPAPKSAASPHDPPKDRLRHWLLGGSDSRADVPQRRFTFHDLVESSGS